MGIDINDESKINKMEQTQTEFETALISKIIEIREKMDISQHELANISGIEQSVIAGIESLKVSPHINTLLKILYPLGYTLSIVPIEQRNNN